MKSIVLLLFFILTLVECNGQVLKFVTNLTPGNLITSMTSEELNTVTFLSISGSIDARDFKTMRDKMPKLEELELSNAIIAEYKGLQGTSNVTGEPEQDIIYMANTVPTDAFYRKESLKQVTLPGTVISIGGHAFFECPHLKWVSIPNSVTSIQVAAFNGCDSLNVQIPASVTDIEILAFTKIGGPIVVDEQNSHYSSINGVLFNKDQIQLISCPVFISGKYEIPESVKTIENYAFLGCKLLTTAQFPQSVTSIGDLAFSECSSLTSISIPATVPILGIRTFMYCSNLTTVQLPVTLTTIQSGAFSYCENLKSIDIPSSVTTIGENVFQNCTRLNAIYARPIKPIVLTSNIFSGVDITKCVLYVREESVDLYKTAPYWKDFQHLEGILTSIDQQRDATISVFPNPAKDEITIHADKGIVAIYNSHGTLKLTQSFQNNQKVNIRNLAPGIYVVVVNGERFKMVKE